MTRHLNGVKYPKSQEDLDVVVERVEERFAAHLFIPVSASIILNAVKTDSYVADVIHAEECRCDTCIRAYLEAMEKRTAEFGIQMEKAVEIVEEINYVG